MCAWLCSSFTRLLPLLSCTIFSRLITSRRPRCTFYTQLHLPCSAGCKLFQRIVCKEVHLLAVYDKQNIVKLLLEMLCIFVTMHRGLISSKRKVSAPVHWLLVCLPWTFFAPRGIGLTFPICPWFSHEFQMNAVHCGSLNCCRSWDIVSGRRPVVTRVPIICLPKKIANWNPFFDKFAKRHEFLSQRELNSKLTGKDSWELVCALEMTSNAEHYQRIVFFGLER